MGLAQLGKTLRAVLLSVLVLALWEAQSAATWKTAAESEPQPYLTCTLNQTEEEAQFEGDLTHMSARRWLKGDPAQEARLRSHAKDYEVSTEDPNGDYQCAFPGKVADQKTSGREKERPKVFTNRKTDHALEGENVILVCESHSYPSVDSWDWYRHREVEGEVLLLLNGTGQRVFITERAHLNELLLCCLDASEDPGRYICIGTNSQGYHAAVVLLKVRGQLAALWPFLSIVFKVLVLFAIILLNEHSRTLAEELAED